MVDYGSGPYGDGIYGGTLTVVPSPLTVRRIGSYATRTVLWRADRYGNRLDAIPNQIPVSGSISYNEDNEIKRSLSLTVNDPGSLRPFRDFVIPEISLIAPDGTVTTRPFGHFQVVPQRITLTPGRMSGTIEAKDITHLLARSAVGAITFPVGTDPGTAVREGFLSSGFAPSQIAIPDTGRQLTAAMTPDPGTNWLKVATDLLNAVNWYAPWMQGNGTVTTGPWGDLQSAVPRKTYRTADGGVELIPPIEEEPDWARLRNEVTVRNVAPDRAPIWATARITNPAHPLFYDPLQPQIGFGMRWAGPPIDDPQVPDQATAYARALSLLSEGASYYRKLRLRTVIDLDAGAHDVLGLDVRRGNDVAYGGNWWCRSWTVDLGNVTATTSRDLYRVEQMA